MVPNRYAYRPETGLAPASSPAAKPSGTLSTSDGEVQQGAQRLTADDQDQSRWSSPTSRRASQLACVAKARVVSDDD